MAYSDSLSYLYGLERFGMIFGLEKISQLLSLLGDPHLGLRCCHVAGSNGKGSVCVMIAHVLERAYRVGLYTSPHLHSFNERIKINGEEISDQEVIELVEVLRGRVQEEGGPEGFTFFDFTTAMAFYYFAQKGVDLAVVEVGLGGRLDSTNVLLPEVTVITEVSKEHTQVLGNTLGEIAKEKGGIIKEGVPVVCGVQEGEALEVIEEEAEGKGAELILLGRDFHFFPLGGRRLDFRGRRVRWEGLEVSLLGEHQLFNAALALATLEVLQERGYPIGEGEIREGLKGVVWPGRMEFVSQRPPILLDGAHNPEGAKALAKALGALSYRRLLLLLGIMDDKDVEGIVGEIVPLATEVVACRPENPRSLDPKEIAKAVLPFGPKVKVIEAVGEGLRYLMEEAQEGDLILVTGSLFTVAEAREYVLGGER